MGSNARGQRYTSGLGNGGRTDTITGEGVAGPALTRTWIASSWSSPPLGAALGQLGRVTVGFSGYIAFVQKVVKECMEPLLACPLASASRSRFRTGKDAPAHAFAHDVAEALSVKHDAHNDERSSQGVKRSLDGFDLVA